jgi:hypothetical protein
MVVGKPIIRQEDNGKSVAMEIKLESTMKPDILWTFNKQTIISGGRYFINVVSEEKYYIIILRIVDVS